MIPNYSAREMYEQLFVLQVIPNYSGREMYERLFALGVTMYGQMTAGSYCYIGPQGIVHGTTVRWRCTCRLLHGYSMLLDLQYR